MEDKSFKENNWGNFQLLCIAIVQDACHGFVGMIEWKQCFMNLKTHQFTYSGWNDFERHLDNT